MSKINEDFPNQKNRQKDFDCSIGFAMTVIGSKWRSIILWHIIRSDALRYSDLKKSIPRISHKILSQELKALEADGLIERTQYPTVPPKVEYSATKRGKTLERVLTEICNWGKEYMDK